MQLSIQVLYKNKNSDMQRVFYCFVIAEFSFLAHWWVQAECNLHISPEDQRELGKHHSVCMVNHTYEIDWLMAWMMAERHGMLGVRTLTT